MDSQTIKMSELLKEFQKFWALHSDKYLQGVRYVEAGPHFLLSAFLFIVVNGGATVTNEFADGLGYADIGVQYAGRKYLIELKIKDNEASRAKSLKQLLGYMDNALAKEGWLVVFNRKPNKDWAKKATWEEKSYPGGKKIYIVGC
jgi:hypothetical protein